jgi:hypothetical protein
MPLPFVKKDPQAAAKTMSANGSEPTSIYETMQQEGISPPVASDAISSPMPPPFVTSQKGPVSLNPRSIVEDVPPPFIPTPPQQYMPSTNLPYPAQAQSSFSNNDDIAEIEELIEQIIDEKWKEIEKNIAKVIDWKERTESDMQLLRQQITDLKDEFDSIQKAIVGKVGEYDKNLVSVGSQLAAMEKAFSKMLPSFVENVGELDRITKRLKN